MVDYELKIFKRNEELKKEIRELRYRGDTKKDPVLYKVELDSLESQIKLNEMRLYDIY